MYQDSIVWNIFLL